MSTKIQPVSAKGSKSVVARVALGVIVLVFLLCFSAVFAAEVTPAKGERILYDAQGRISIVESLTATSHCRVKAVYTLTRPRVDLFALYANAQKEEYIAAFELVVPRARLSNENTLPLLREALGLCHEYLDQRLQAVQTPPRGGVYFFSSLARVVY